MEVAIAGELQGRRGGSQGGAVIGTEPVGDVTLKQFSPHAAASPVHCGGAAGFLSWYTVVALSPLMSVLMERTVTSEP